MSEFAKLYGIGDNQVVVFIQSDDDGNPEVRVFFQPPDLGVCSIAIGFEDTDDGWNKAEEAFDKMTEERVRGMVGKTMKELEVAAS